MEHRKGGGTVRLYEIRIKLAEPGTGQHSFIYDAPAGTACDIKGARILPLFLQFTLNAVFGYVPGKKQTGFQAVRIGQILRVARDRTWDDKKLAQVRQGLIRPRVQYFREHRYFSLVFDEESAGSENFPETSQAERSSSFIPREKELSHSPQGRMFFQDRPLAEKKLSGQR